MAPENKKQKRDIAKYHEDIANLVEIYRKRGPLALETHLNMNPQYGDADNDTKITIHKDISKLKADNIAGLSIFKNQVDTIMATQERNDAGERMKAFIRKLANKSPFVAEQKLHNGDIQAGQPASFKMRRVDLEVCIRIREEEITALKYELLRRQTCDYREVLNVILVVCTPDLEPADITTSFQSQEVYYDSDDE